MMKKIIPFVLIIILLASCNTNTTEPKTVEDNQTTKKVDDQSTPNSAEQTPQKEPSEDKIHALKVVYFTEELNLSTKEAEKFWPIYNKHNEIYESLRDAEWDAIKKGLREVDTYTDEDAEVLLSRYKNYLNQRLENRLAFINELNTVISSKKIMQLKHAEYNFNKKLLKQYRSKEATKK